MPWSRNSESSSLLCEGLRSNDACAAFPRAAAATEEATHTSKAALLSWDSSGGENISRPEVRSCEPSGFRGDARICQPHAADHGVNARVALPRGFGVAASFCVLQLWVQEGTAAPTLFATHPDSVVSSEQ